MASSTIKKGKVNIVVLNNFTTLSSVYDELNQRYDVVGRGGIGNSNTGTLKSIIPAPTDFGGYVEASIKYFGNRVLTVTARDAINLKLATCFIASDDDNSWYKTDWVILKS